MLLQVSFGCLLANGSGAVSKGQVLMPGALPYVFGKGAEFSGSNNLPLLIITMHCCNAESGDVWCAAVRVWKGRQVQPVQRAAAAAAAAAAAVYDALL
jgi:hypothetical protein